MSKLYIGNATPQVHDFVCIVPDNDQGTPTRNWRPQTQQIPPGQQIIISGDLSSAQITAIVDQHRKYGLIEVSEIDRSRAFVGICYSVDKPISETRIRQLMSHNIDILDARGRKMRELAAVSVSNGVESQMRDNRMPGELTKVEMEVTELRNDRSDSDETAPHLIRVSRDGEGAGAPAPKRAYKRRAA